VQAGDGTGQTLVSAEQWDGGVKPGCKGPTVTWIS
jgi:hypothetical protein